MIFAWEDISKIDMLVTPSGRQTHHETDATTPPPLSAEMTARFRMPAKAELTQLAYQTLWLEAALHWGGTRRTP